MPFALEDYLRLTPATAEFQWRSILGRRDVAPGHNQVDYVPVETLLCAAAMLVVGDTSYGSGMAKRGPHPIPELAALFKRRPTSITSKMANLDGGRGRGGKSDERLWDVLSTDHETLYDLYRVVVVAARAVGIGSQQLPDFLALERGEAFSTRPGRTRRVGAGGRPARGLRAVHALAGEQADGTASHRPGPHRPAPVCARRSLQLRMRVRLLRLLTHGGAASHPAPREPHQALAGERARRAARRAQRRGSLSDSRRRVRRRGPRPDRRPCRDHIPAREPVHQRRRAHLLRRAPAPVPSQPPAGELATPRPLRALAPRHRLCGLSTPSGEDVGRHSVQSATGAAWVGSDRAPRGPSGHAGH